jgi:hypothetical protein
MILLPPSSRSKRKRSIKLSNRKRKTVTRQPRRWKLYIISKRLCACTGLHRSTSQKTSVLHVCMRFQIFTAVESRLYCSVSTYQAARCHNLEYRIMKAPKLIAVSRLNGIRRGKNVHTAPRAVKGCYAHTQHSTLTP